MNDKESVVAYHIRELTQEVSALRERIRALEGQSAAYDLSQYVQLSAELAALKQKGSE